MTKAAFYMSVEEMADYFGISRSAAYQLIHRADFPALRIGRRVVIPVERLNEWVNSQLHAEAR